MCCDFYHLNYLWLPPSGSQSSVGRALAMGFIPTDTQLFLPFPLWALKSCNNSTGYWQETHKQDILNQIWNNFDCRNFPLLHLIPANCQAFQKMWVWAQINLFYKDQWTAHFLYFKVEILFSQPWDTAFPHFILTYIFIGVQASLTVIWYYHYSLFLCPFAIQ